MTTTTVEERVAHLEAQVAELRGERPHLATSADIERLEGRMLEIEVRMTRWLVGTMLAGFAVVIAALKLLP